MEEGVGNSDGINLRWWTGVTSTAVECLVLRQVHQHIFRRVSLLMVRASTRTPAGDSGVHIDSGRTTF